MARVARAPRRRTDTDTLVKLAVDRFVPTLDRDQLSDLVYRMDSDPDFLDKLIAAVDVHGKVRVPEMYADLTRPDPEDAADEEEDD